MRELVLRALLSERLPEWRKATIERVRQGQTDNAFRLTLGERRAFCKVDTLPRPSTVNSRTEEAAIQQRVAKHGLSPNVLYSDEHCIVTEYIEAKVLTADDLAFSGTIASLGQQLKQLHKLSLTGRRFDAAAAGKIYATTIEDQATSDRCLAAIDAMQSDDELVFSHNDMVAGNILLAESIIFIDWEYACDNSPLFDIATVVAHHALDVETAQALLDARFGHSDRDLFARLMNYVRGYRALYWLWLANRDPSDRRLKALATLLDNP